MEKELLKWLDIILRTGEKVTTKKFKEMAIFYSKDSNFRASKGWLQKFRKRNKIQLN